MDRSLVLLAAACALGACAARGPAPSPFPPETLGYGYTRADAPQREESYRLIALDDATRAATGDLVLTRHWPATPPAETDPAVWLTLRFADGATLIFQEGNHTVVDTVMQAPGAPLARLLGLTGDARPTLYHSVVTPDAARRGLCAGDYDLGMGRTADGTIVLAAYVPGDAQVDGAEDFNSRAWPDNVVRACAMLRYRRG